MNKSIQFSMNHPDSIFILAHCTRPDQYTFSTFKLAHIPLFKNPVESYDPTGLQTTSHPQCIKGFIQNSIVYYMLLSRMHNPLRILTFNYIGLLRLFLYFPPNNRIFLPLVLQGTCRIPLYNGTDNILYYLIPQIRILSFS